MKNVFSSSEKFPRKGGRKVSSTNIDDDYSSRKCEKMRKMDSSRGVARIEGSFFFFQLKDLNMFIEYWRRFSHIHEIENAVLQEKT